MVQYTTTNIQRFYQFRKDVFFERIIILSRFLKRIIVIFCVCEYPETVD